MESNYAEDDMDMGEKGIFRLKTIARDCKGEWIFEAKT